MKRLSDCQQKQMMVEKKEGMEMSMHSCHTTMYVFGFLVIVGLAIQIFLQAKMIKELRKTNKRR